MKGDVMSGNVQHVRSSSYHARYGEIENAFKYKMDYLLVPAHEDIDFKSSILKYNKFGLFSFYDKDHGEGGSLQSFTKQILKSQKLEKICDGPIWLLTQPRYLGYVFNPVSFWYFHDKKDQLRMVMAEVNNRAGGRHFYICRHDDNRPIKTKDKIQVDKLFHVSPFQEMEGEYEFKFHFEPARVGAWIDYKNGNKGLYATLTGEPEPLKTGRLLAGALMLPFGAMRVVFLIYWQAIKLKSKGADFRSAPKQNDERISR